MNIEHFFKLNVKPGDLMRILDDIEPGSEDMCPCCTNAGLIYHVIDFKVVYGDGSTVKHQTTLFNIKTNRVELSEVPTWHRWWTNPQKRYQVIRP